MKELLEIIQSQNDRITKLEKQVLQMQAFLINTDENKKRNTKLLIGA